MDADALLLNLDASVPSKKPSKAKYGLISALQSAGVRFKAHMPHVFCRAASRRSSGDSKPRTGGILPVAKVFKRLDSVMGMNGSRNRRSGRLSNE